MVAGQLHHHLRSLFHRMCVNETGKQEVSSVYTLGPVHGMDPTM
jgi:hypothetical protein